MIASYPKIPLHVVTERHHRLMAKLSPAQAALSAAAASAAHLQSVGSSSSSSSSSIPRPIPPAAPSLYDTRNGPPPPLPPRPPATSNDGNPPASPPSLSALSSTTFTTGSSAGSSKSNGGHVDGAPQQVFGTGPPKAVGEDDDGRTALFGTSRMYQPPPPSPPITATSSMSMGSQFFGESKSAGHPSMMPWGAPSSSSSSMMFGGMPGRIPTGVSTSYLNVDADRPRLDIPPSPGKQLKFDDLRPSFVFSINDELEKFLGYSRQE
jgi:hypothetical protein